MSGAELPLSELSEQEAFASRLMFRRPAWLWVALSSILAAAGPYWALLGPETPLGAYAFGATLLAIDIALLVVVLAGGRGHLRKQHTVAHIFALSGLGLAALACLGAAFWPGGPGLAALASALPLAILVGLPFCVLAGVLTGWLCFDAVTAPPTS